MVHEWKSIALVVFLSLALVGLWGCDDSDDGNEYIGDEDTTEVEEEDFDWMDGPEIVNESPELEEEIVEAEEEVVTATLDEKLEAQFDLYEQARTAIITRVVDETGVVTRDEWEEWLTPEADYVLSDDDLTDLRQSHQDIIATGRTQAIADSTLDLEQFRDNATEVQRYCTELPKGGMIHIHPSGTRDRDTVIALLEELNPTVDGADILEEANDGVLTMLYDDEVTYLTNLPVKKYLEYEEADRTKIQDLFFLPDNPPTHDFVRFEAMFSIADVLLEQDETKLDWVEEKTYLDFLQRAALYKVSYVEFTSVMWPDTATFEQLHTWAEDWYTTTGVTVRWNSAFVRTLDYDTNTTWTNNFIGILKENSYTELVGIDLLANETNTSALETGQNIYIPILDAINDGEMSIHRTMHAGELGDIRNVRDAMIMGAERVGHGVLLWQDPIGLEYARRASLPIEINLYSNYRLQVEEDFSKHPFLSYLRMGMPVSLSTDDEGMFVTDIVNECVVAVTYTDITHAEVKQMAYNSLQTSFADDTLKNGLIEKLDTDFTQFESDWSQYATVE